MKKRLAALAVIPSSAALALLLSEAGHIMRAVFVLAGLTWGVFVYLLIMRLPERKYKLNWLPRALAFAAALVGSYFAHVYFVSGWGSGRGKAVAIGYVLCAGALPSLYAMAALFIRYICALKGVFSLKKTLNELDFSYWRWLKAFLCAIVAVAVAAIAGGIALGAVNRIPVSALSENVKSSALTICEEGVYPVVSSYAVSRLDNFTDGLMIMEAEDSRGGDTLENVVAMAHGEMTDMTPYESLVYHYRDGLEYDELVPYSRYWHGYHITLDPLLLVTDLSGIRVINACAQLVLLALCVLLLYKRGLKRLIIPYILMYLMLMPAALFRSMQYSSCYYVLSIGVILLLLTKNLKKAPVCFLTAGILTAYFDYLTYPMATFGIPALVYTALMGDEDANKKLSRIVKAALMWCVGYGVMWASKWVITEMVTGNGFKDAFGAVAQRTGELPDDAGALFYRVLSIGKNYLYFLHTPVTALCAGYMCVSLLRGRARGAAGRMLPYLVIALAPAVWFFVASNHCLVHYPFAGKASVVTVTALMFCLSELTVKRNKKI